MKLGNCLLIGAAGLAIAALPLNLESIAFGSPEPSSAFAKSDHGGGNGNGNGGGHGHSGEHGKSSDAGGRGKSGRMGIGPGHSGKLRAIAGDAAHGGKAKKATDTRVAKSAKKKGGEVELAALPDTVVVPEPKEKSLHARLAGLNSLKRNYHAYLNSNDPRMASIRAFVMASANDELTDEEVDEALRDALMDAANRNRVAQYGDDYVNDDVMDWAKDVLGVGDDRFGKIDEVRDTLEVDSQ